MVQGITLSVYPVKDIARAKQIYADALGVEPYADAAYYVGFKVGDHEIGLDPQGTAPMHYWQVDDIRKTLQTFVDAGGSVQQDVRDVGGGRVIASVTDPDGNLIALMQSP